MFVPDVVVYTISALMLLGRGDVVAGLDTLVYCLFNPARPRRLRLEREKGEEESDETSDSEDPNSEESNSEDEDDLDFEEDLECEVKKNK